MSARKQNGIAVMQTDGVTRDGHRSTWQTLFHTLFDNWHLGVPMLFSHDIHRPIGWSRPFGLHLEPGMARLVASTTISVGDEEELRENYQHYINATNWKQVGPHKDELRTRLGHVLVGNECFRGLETAACVSPDLARRAFPDLFNIDKDGLVPLSELEVVAPGIFGTKDDSLVVFAHPYFRRNLSRLNAFNSDLLATLSEVPNQQAKVRVRLDPDAVGLRSELRQRIELEYWRGPKFSDDLTQIPPGVTEHKASETDRLFHQIDRTEFWWSERGDNDRCLKVFEAEELREERTFGDGEEQYGCRYVHSIVDLESGVIEHLDGAIRGYTPEQYIEERLALDIAHAGRKSHYTKLWRIDGTIDLGLWKLLIHHHFRNNPLVAEYFGQNAYDVEESAPEVDPTALRAFVPHAMTSADGVRCMLILDPLHTPVEDISVVPIETFRREGEEATWVVDDLTTEIVKELRKAGITPLFDTTKPAKRLRVNDQYAELPHFRCATLDHAQGVFKAIRSILERWSKSGHERVIALRVGVCDAEKEITVSWLGEASELLSAWKKCSALPNGLGRDALLAWVDRVYDRLCEREVALGPDFFDVVKHCGLVLARKQSLECEPYIQEGGLHFKVKLEPNHPAQPLVKKGQITPVDAILIEESECGACGADYTKCLCTKDDPEVFQNIKDFKLMGFYWTDTLTRMLGPIE